MSDKFQPVDSIVVGGGISGLTCAFGLKRQGLSVVLLESTPHVGGCIQSMRSGPYVADGGPQSILATPDFFGLLHDAGLDDFTLRANPQAARPYVLSHGQLMAAPQRPSEILKTPLLSLSGKLRLFNELWITKRTADSDESIASFVRRRAGAEVLDSLAAPFVSGIFAGDPAKLSMRSVFPSAVQFESKHGSVIRGAWAQMRATRNGPAAHPQRRPTIGFRGGNDALPKMLAHHLGADVRTSMPVKAMWQRGEWLEVLVDNGAESRIVGRSVVLATPAYVTAELLQIFDPALHGQLNAIAYPPLVQIALAYPRKAVGIALDGFGFLVARHEDSTILGCVFNSAMFSDRCPSDHVLLTVFMGGATDAAICDKNDVELAHLAHSDLQRVLKIANVTPTVVAGFRWPRAIPQYNLGHAERLSAIEAAVKEIPHLYLCGNYFDGPSVPDCCKLSLSVARRIVNSLSNGT